MMMCRNIFALAALVSGLGACGEDTPQLNDVQAADAIENVAEAQPAPKVEPPGPTLVPLARGDVERELPPGVGCDFSIGDRMLFVSIGSNAVARVNGRIVRFTSTTPIGATGGFFQEPAGRFSISVGRLGEAGVTVGETTSWPSRLSVTDRSREDFAARIEGAWRCGA